MLIEAQQTDLMELEVCAAKDCKCGEGRMGGQGRADEKSATFENVDTKRGVRLNRRKRDEG